MKEKKLIKELAEELIAEIEAADTEEEDADKEEADKEDADAEEETPVITISKEDLERGFTITDVGVYALKRDPDTNEIVLEKSYVEFDITCVYTPVETTTVQNNVDQGE